MAVQPGQLTIVDHVTAVSKLFHWKVRAVYNRREDFPHEPAASRFMQYAYSILFGIVLAEGIGLPLPATLALLISGGASAQGKIDARVAIAIAMTALLIADNLLFALGRRSGWGCWACFAASR